MGIVDRIIEARRGVFEVHDPWVTGEELGTGLGVFLGTWEGELRVSVAWNEAWHEEEEVRGYLGELVEGAFGGMGVDVDVDVDVEGGGGKGKEWWTFD